MRFQLESSSGKVLMTNLPEVCRQCVKTCTEIQGTQKVKCKLDKRERRQGIKKGKRGRVYLCSSQNDDLRSSKVFAKNFSTHLLLLSQIDSIKENVKNDLVEPTKRLTHNITSLNAHCLQEFYSVVPQEELSNNYKDQLKMVDRIIKSNTLDAAKTFLRVLKNNRLMKTELSVFEKLYDTDTKIKKRKHDIRKVLLSAFHVYFQDFTDKKIVVNISDGQFFAFFDYESVIVSLMHLADNAAKYSCVKSSVDIDFEEKESKILLKVKMLSMKIEDEDVENIFTGGYSGVNAEKMGKSGSGLGLNIVAKLLELNDASILMNRNCIPKKSKNVLSVPYEINEVVVSFQKFNN